MPYYPPASGGSGLPTTGGTMTGTITSTIGTITASTPILSATQTWNNAAVAFKAIFVNIGNTALASGSYVLEFQRASSRRFSVDVNGEMVANVFEQLGGQFRMQGSGLSVYNDFILGWGNNSAFGGNSVGLARPAAGVLNVMDGVTIGTLATVAAKEFRFSAPTQTNGQYAAVLSLTELTTIAAAATTDTTIQMPANSIVLAVSVRVTTAIPTATNFTVGDSGSATRFSTAAVSSALNATDPGTKAGAYYNASALSVRITPDATPGANTGRVRVTIHYITVTPPTS